MIAWLSNWAQGIIVAVIIAVIIEMILPQGSIKKYVKVVIGIYIVFTIIAPIIIKLSNGKANLNNIFDTSVYAKEMEESDNKVTKELDSDNSRTIKDIYTNNLEDDLKGKLEKKGYNTSNIYIKVKDDKNYTIEKINLSLEKAPNNNNSNDSGSSINKITIQINDISSNDVKTNNNTKKLSDEDKNKIKNYLSDEYNIGENDISID